MSSINNPDPLRTEGTIHTDSQFLRGGAAAPTDLDQKIAAVAARAIRHIPDAVYSDKTKRLVLITNQNQPEHPSTSEWELNFGLLYSAYQRAKDPKTKVDIAFLVANFLEKAATFNDKLTIGIDLPQDEIDKYKEGLQLGVRSGRNIYHRLTGCYAQKWDGLIPSHKVFSSISPENIVVLDTIHVNELFPLSFNIVPEISNPEKSTEFLVQNFIENIMKDPNSLNSRPCLIDLTNQIGQSLIMSDSGENLESFENSKKNAKTVIQSILTSSAEQIKQDYSELHPEISLLSVDQIYDSLLKNIAFISRAEVDEDLALLLNYPDLFNQDDFKNISLNDFRNKNIDISNKINIWVSLTSVGIGAVKSRLYAAAALENITDITKDTLLRPTNYVVSGETSAYMYDLVDLLNSNILHTLEVMGTNKLQYGKAQSLLSKATHKIIRTLLTSIKETAWDHIHDDPIKREIIQNSLQRMMQHLATATHNYFDFRVFSQAIDRAHTELTTLLLFFTPFKPEDFKKSYGAYLKPMMPESIIPQVIGVAKSAMNIFAGVNAAVLSTNSNAVISFGDHSYYESQNLMNKTETFDQILSDPNVDSIDLYAGEFYHNIVAQPEFSHYKKGKVIEDIKKIFKIKPHTNKLTVALDATIDFTNSKDLKKLLKSFEREIHEGRINFVIYRSGQKFDMLGLDNYFGAPYYIINNGDPKWEKFNSLETAKALKPDPLSEQFFALAAASGPGMMDDYKKQIFKNTQNILNHVPGGLKPGLLNTCGVCIATKDPDVHSPFIDIKFSLSTEFKNDEMMDWSKSRFTQMFLKENKLTYERASFGFAHPNISFIGNKLRINPGLDPSENKIYYQFFKEMEVFANQLKNRRI
jgi:hypothetical protein